MPASPRQAVTSKRLQQDQEGEDMKLKDLQQCPVHQPRASLPDAATLVEAAKEVRSLRINQATSRQYGQSILEQLKSKREMRSATG